MSKRPAPVRFLVLAALAALPFGLTGEVLDLGDNGFTVKQTVTVGGDAAHAYAALVDVGKWWDPAHTWSGDAANLTIDPKAQGCWCEKLPPAGSVRHMTVVFASPGKMLRFEGGLGPLQSMAVAGVMTWTFQPAEKGTTVEVTYVVGGYNPGGFKNLAPGVDGVLHAQLERYRKFTDTGKP